MAELKARKIAVLDRYGKLTVVTLGGAPEVHTHTWSEITDAPEMDKIVQTGEDGKISADDLPTTVVQKGEDGKLPAEALPDTVIQKGEDGKLPADSLPGMGTGETPLVLGNTNGQAGKFDRLTTTPTAGTPLRYNGNFRATKVFGVYFSDNADLAEMYPVEGDWEPGDLIMVCRDGSLRRNDFPLNRQILGIVSTNPGMVLGQKTEGAPIALAGRVPVWVDGTALPGDYLAASPIAGHVWKVDPEEAPRGSIVAMALEAKPTMEPGLVLALVLRM